VQVKHEIVAQRDLSNEFAILRKAVEAMDDTANKEQLTPGVGHELFKPGPFDRKGRHRLHLLVAGNPKPENILVSPCIKFRLTKNCGEKPRRNNLDVRRASVARTPL
jgi:hypothetical protein